jgi:uncharacterized membrane protein HdeD (DUF308 family)
MNLTSLIHNWWMIAIRGVLAIAFGLAVLLGPRVTLSTVTVLFGVYAILDGGWTLAAARRASERLLEAWPVVLEGAVSIGLGLLALFFPFVWRQFFYALAFWGVVTGVLELIAAIRLPREGAGHWMLGTAGASSLFLALMILRAGVRHRPALRGPALWPRRRGGSTLRRRFLTAGARPPHHLSATSGTCSRASA